MTETSTTHDFFDIPSGFDDYDDLNDLDDGTVGDAGGGRGDGGDTFDDGGGGDGGGGLGNLADELADAWDEEEAGEGGIEQLEPRTLDEQVSGRINDLSLDDDTASSITSKRKSAHHQRADSQSSKSEIEEAEALSSSLNERISSIEKLLHYPRGNELVSRVVQQLRDISGQSKIETNTSRLITANSSVTLHLASQTRALQASIQPLLYAQLTALSPEDIDGIIPLIDDLIPQLPYPVLERQRRQQELQQQSSRQQEEAEDDQERGEIDHNETLPRQQQVPSMASSSSSSPESHPHRQSQPQAQHSHQQEDPVLSLRALLSQTSSLIHDLRSISDTLHESRQLTSVATRRLRSVRELVAEIRWDEEVKEEGLRFIEKGEWNRRLEERETGKACRDVVSGFETFCGEWRKKLFGSETPEVTVS